MNSQVAKRRWVLTLNIAALTVLYSGYLLTTGTGAIAGTAEKAIFRLLAVSLIILSIIMQGRVSLKYLLWMPLLLALLLLNESPIAINAIFLILISFVFQRLSQHEVAVTLLIPTLVMVGLHLLLWGGGMATTVVTDFDGRVRSAVGFSNANQASVVYLSLVVAALFYKETYPTRTARILFVVSFLMASFIVTLTDSRTTMFSLGLLAALHLSGALLLRFQSYRVAIKALASISPLIGCAVTYFVTTSQDQSLNIALSLRPEFFAEFVYGISATEFLFGWSRTDLIGVDNFFLMLLSGLGAAGSTLVIISMIALINRIQARHAPLIIVMMAASIFESFLLRPELPISAVFLQVLLAAGRFARSGSPQVAFESAPSRTGSRCNSNLSATNSVTMQFQNLKKFSPDQQI
jgi:hypothetical protein